MADFDPEEAASAVAEALRPLGTPERAVQEKRYLKSDLEFFGVAMPDLRRTASVSTSTAAIRRSCTGSRHSAAAHASAAAPSSPG